MEALKDSSSRREVARLPVDVAEHRTGGRHEQQQNERRDPGGDSTQRCIHVEDLKTGSG